MSFSDNQVELHLAVEQMMLQIMQHFQSTEVSGRLTLSIECVADAAARNAHVKFRANIGYGSEDCQSDNLFEAYARALRRKQEDKMHQPRLIHIKEPREVADE